jgi:hypothetical protein
MRSLILSSICLLSLAAGSAAQAKIAITVDKDNQQMTVVVNGEERYHWPVSTGNPSHETPNGTFQTFRMEADHFSKEFDDAPMPHSIFFTKMGHAMHGTDSESRLGTPVSHGCVRLSKANATTLYALVEADGVLNTTVTLTGSSRVALAHIARTRPTAVARGDDMNAPVPSDDAAGQPVNLYPQPVDPAQQVMPQQRVQRQVFQQQPQQAVPQQRADDGYIYPADGSSSEQRYPAPPGYRRVYDAQATQPQQYYYDSRGYPHPYQQQAPRPYQPRGFFAD